MKNRAPKVSSLMPLYMDANSAGSVIQHIFYIVMPLEIKFIVIDNELSNKQVH